MKKICFTVVFIATAFLQQSFAQDSTSQAQLTKLLQSYYDIKNALVAGSANAAASKADDFIRIANDINQKDVSVEARSALLKDATLISKAKEIGNQRGYFANFSANMFALAKSVKLTSAPVYEAYCPMKKAYWLSSEKAIKNPYYGSAMLTCGSVKETL